MYIYSERERERDRETEREASALPTKNSKGQLTARTPCVRKCIKNNENR
jgi:hypothetical protein